MADEAHVIRGIDYKAAFPFTQIFKSFRLAAHPSKILLALVALLAVYIGGKILDEAWPSGYRAVAGEISLYATSRTATAPGSDFGRLRQERLDLEHARYEDLRRQTNKADADLDDVKDMILRVRDKNVADADALFRQIPNPSQDEVVRHQDVIHEAYATATRSWEEASAVARHRGPFFEFLEYENGQFYGVINGVTEWHWLGSGGVVESIRNFFIIGPGWAFRHHGVYFTIFGLWFLIVWSVFGGAVSRIAAVHFAREEKISVRQALRFSSSKFLSFISAPIIPIAIVLIVGLVLAAGGFLTNIPFIGPIIVGVLFFLALAAGVVMTLVLLGLVGGCNLMYPTIAAEGSDSFDAISRSFSYLYARPWRLAFYTAVALIYGALTYWFVRFFIGVVLKLAHFFGGLFVFGHAPNTSNIWSMLWSSPMASGRLTYNIDYLTLNFPQDVGATLIAIWVYLAISLLGAYAISFYFTSNTIIYFLLRNEVDATELDDVYLETGDDEFAEAGPMTEPEAASAESTTAASTTVAAGSEAPGQPIPETGSTAISGAPSPTDTSPATGSDADST